MPQLGELLSGQALWVLFLLRPHGAPVQTDVAGTVPGTQTQRVLTSSQESPLLSFRFDFAWEWVILSVEADLTCGPVHEGEAGSSRTVYIEGLGLNRRSCSRTVVHG